MSTSDHPLDELLTAYLDGEASADERARVEEALASDPVFAEQHQRLTAVVAFLEPPVAAPPEVVDAQIARAMAAAVVDLTAARRARRRPAVLAAAAAIAGVFLVGALLALRGGSDDVEVAGGSPSGTAEVATAADATATPMLEAETAAATAAADDATSTPEADLRDGGQAEAWATEELDAALAEAIRALLAAGDAPAVPPDTPCTDAVEPVSGVIGPVESSGLVTVEGVPLALYVGTERVAVVDQACAVRVVPRPAG